MNDNYLTLCSIDMKLCRITYETYYTNARRMEMTPNTSATQSMSSPSYRYNTCIHSEKMSEIPV